MPEGSVDSGGETSVCSLFDQSSNNTIHNWIDFRKNKFTPLSAMCNYSVLTCEVVTPAHLDCAFYQLTLKRPIDMLGHNSWRGEPGKNRWGRGSNTLPGKWTTAFSAALSFFFFFSIRGLLHIKVGWRFRCRPPGLTNPARNASSIRPCNQECAAKQVC